MYTNSFFYKFNLIWNVSCRKLQCKLSTKTYFWIINKCVLYLTAVTSGVSFVMSSISTVLLFSGMQMYKGWLSSTQLHTILCGYIGSLVFLFLLTALGNLESMTFGKSFQMKFFPEGSCPLKLSIYKIRTRSIQISRNY